MIKCFSLLILIYLNPCPSEFETMDREAGKRVRQVLLLNRLESPQEQEHFLDNLSRNSKFRNLLGRLYPSNQESGARTDGPDPCSSNGFIWITALCFIQGNQPIVFESLALYLAEAYESINSTLCDDAEDYESLNSFSLPEVQAESRSRGNAGDPFDANDQFDFNPAMISACLFRFIRQHNLFDSLSGGQAIPEGYKPLKPAASIRPSNEPAPGCQHFV